MPGDSKWPNFIAFFACFFMVFFCIGPFPPKVDMEPEKNPTMGKEKHLQTTNYCYSMFVFWGCTAFVQRRSTSTSATKKDFPTSVIFQVLSCDVKTEDVFFFSASVFLEMVHFTVKTPSLPWFMKIICGGGSVYSTTDFFYPNLSWCRKQKRKSNNIIMSNAQYIGEAPKNNTVCNIY